MLTRYQIHIKKSRTFVENSGIVWEKETDMAHAFPPVTSRIESRSRFGVVTEFEPLPNSEQAADLLQIHHETLQKLARRDEIRGTHIGKLWRFRASDLNEWFNRSERAAG
jgi:excisionase family DNA binding protein